MGIIHNPALRYRPEIDGLRTLAVIPVILFHAGLPLFSGGFIGVDVFFVISGYLITSIILAQMRAGKFSLINFYERRARRILPSLFVMMLVCLPLAWLTLDPPDFKYFSKSLVAVPLFSSNILFWKESGYFDATAELKPLLHTWTLAVEEQYYLFFPLLLMLLRRLDRRWVVSALLLIAVISLALSQRGALQDSSATFYLLHARAWELLIGSFIAFYFSWRPHSAQSTGALHELASALGIGLIGYAVVSFDNSTPFPGLHALVPTLGAALIIVFANAHTHTGRLLGSRPLVLIGLISYSAYLWHQPIFAFARHSSLIPPGIPLMLGLSLLSLIIAYLSWRFVEQVFREKERISRQQIFSGGALASVLFIGIGLTGYLNNGFSQRFNVDPSIFSAFTDPEVRNSCDRNYDGKGWNIDFCLFGAADKKVTPDAAIFGDSHSEALLPAFDAIAREQGETIVHIGLGGCPPLLGVDVAHGNYEAGVCSQLAAREYDYVKQHRIKKVVLISRWTLYTDGDYDKKKMTEYFLTSSVSQEKTREASRAVFRKALENTIEAYRDIGTDVFIVAQVPQQMINPKNLYYRLARETSESEADKLRVVSELSVPVAKHIDLQRFTRELFEQDNRQKRITLVNLDRAFCKDQWCLIGDTRSWYKDFNHLNANGIQLIAGEIGSILTR